MHCLGLPQATIRKIKGIDVSQEDRHDVEEGVGRQSSDRGEDRSVDFINGQSGQTVANELEVRVVPVIRRSIWVFRLLKLRSVRHVRPRRVGLHDVAQPKLFTDVENASGIRKPECRGVMIDVELRLWLFLLFPPVSRTHVMPGMWMLQFEFGPLGFVAASVQPGEFGVERLFYSSGRRSTLALYSSSFTPQWR